MSSDKQNVIIYNTADGKASVSLYAEIAATTPKAPKLEKM